MERYSVLIVEDDATLLRGLKDNFEFKGYDVMTASDGEAGVEAALSHEPDLILLDIMLPGINGFEVCRRIREADFEMPIIMLTAKGQEEDITWAPTTTSRSPSASRNCWRGLTRF